MLFSLAMYGTVTQYIANFACLVDVWIWPGSQFSWIDTKDNRNKNASRQSSQNSKGPTFLPRNFTCSDLQLSVF